MNDQINRDDAIKAIYHHFPQMTMRECAEVLHDVPSAQPERKKGRWIDDCTCSICYWVHEDSKGFALLTNYPFCPNCGAMMEGEEDE